MSKIISIGTAVAEYRHEQSKLFDFVQRVYAVNEADKRKLRYLFTHGGIENRYSVIPDYSLEPSEWKFYPATENLEPFPRLEKRMKWFHEHAPLLSMQAINNCLENKADKNITHIITVSCTGMSAPGLDLQLLDLLGLPPTTFRSSVNFMGCYAAIHALRMAEAFCRNDINARVLVVCTELCSLHFQKEYTEDNIVSSLLFGDGSAAVLISGDDTMPGLSIDHFYSYVATKGKQDMAWELGSKGFQMTLSGYVPDLIEEDFGNLVGNTLATGNLKKEDITRWCIHPGGKRILEAIHKSLGFTNGQLRHSHNTLRDYGNMSSATILFVLKEIMKDIIEKKSQSPEHKEFILGAAFGPGLTMETFILSA